jgi:uncharacterized lipoprotein YddW (UPF0748 family)
MWTRAASGSVSLSGWATPGILADAHEGRREPDNGGETARRGGKEPSMRHPRMLNAAVIAFSIGATASAAPTLKGRAVWASPREAGTSEATVVAFVDQLAKAHVNTLIMELKTSAGIFWPSERFAPAVVPEYKTFDLPAVLIRECHERGIAFHVWFFDFAEGGNSYVVQQHPEWLALSPDGKPTMAEVLRGQPYRMAWMCPARRPGYTDQWLIPLIAEFAQRYDVDAVHHDYVRYPGDLAPDTYCFCDYCLGQIPKYASYYSTTHPEASLLRPFDRPHLEAHWETSPKVLPPNWDDYSREMKSRFLLEGSFFPGGHRDLDYFFYEYRVHHVTEFVRGVFEEVRKVRPKMEFSAAVFKNPVQSGRFIGQDWRQFAPWVQYAMPMDYRSHFGGDFETHLDLLAEAIQQQKVWARDFQHFWPGVAAYQLYEEERAPLTRIRGLLRDGGKDVEGVRTAFAAVAPRLRTYAPDLRAALEAWLKDPKSPEAPLAKLDAFLADVPEGYYPAEKLARVLERVRAQDVEGAVIFSSGGITSAKLWKAVKEFFGE